MDKQKLNQFLEEAYGSYLRMEAEKDQMKSIKEKIHDELGIEKKLVGKLVRYYCKDDLEADKQAVSEIEGYLQGA